MKKRQKYYKNWRWWITPKRKHFSDMSGLVNTWIHKDCQQFQDLQRLKPDKIPASRRGSRHTFSALTKKLSTIYPCSERKINFSLIEQHWVYPPESRTCPINQQQINKTKWTLCFYMCFLLLLMLLWGEVSGFVVFIFVCLLFQERKNMKLAGDPRRIRRCKKRGFQYII